MEIKKMDKKMKVENLIRIFAGLFVFVSALLGYFVHQYYLIITMLVGLNLFQFGFTGFCPLKMVLLKLGFKE